MPHQYNSAHFHSAFQTCGKPIRCGNDSNFASLAKAYGKILDQLQAEFPHAEIHIDFTSGTKPMSAAAAAAAISRKIPYVHYSIGVRDETGRASKTTSCPAIDTGPLIAEQALQEWGRLFNLGQFTAVQSQAEALARQLGESPLQQQAQSLAHLAKAYGYWDRFDWKMAADALRRFSSAKPPQEFVAAGWDVAEFAEQHEHLRRCRFSEPTRDRQVDLFVNAERRLESGQADDAVSRLYRLTELLLQDRFLVHFPDQNKENATSKVPKAELRAKLSEFTEELVKRRGDREKFDLGLFDTMKALYKLEDPVATAMLESYTGGAMEYSHKRGDFGNLLEKRNNSWLAHGTAAISSDVARALRDEVHKFLEMHFQTPPTESIAPARLEDSLKPARFSHCPWV